MKHLRYLLNYLILSFSKIPVYLRGITIFLILLLITSIINKTAKTKYIEVKANKKYVKLEDIKKTTKKEENKDFTKTVDIDEKNNSFKVTIKENLKSRFFNKKISNKYSDKKSLNDFSDDYIFGDINASVTIVDYSSFTCPHCIKFNKENMNQVKANYIDKGKVKYIKRILIQKNTLLGVMLPYCAKSKNKYTLMNDLFDNTSLWIKNKNELKKIALKNGFTESQYKECIKNEDLAKKLLKRRHYELNELKIYSTPTIFINKEKSSGSFSYKELSEKIEKALKKINNS